MCENIHIEIHGIDFSFYCKSRSTRSGFAHDCDLFINHDHEQTAHAYYLNRTWESWRFQTVCITAIGQEIDWRKEVLKSNYKDVHNVSRITKKHAAIMETEYQNDIYLQNLLACKEELKKGRYY